MVRWTNKQQSKHQFAIQIVKARDVARRRKTRESSPTKSVFARADPAGAGDKAKAGAEEERFDDPSCFLMHHNIDLHLLRCLLATLLVLFATLAS